MDEPPKLKRPRGITILAIYFIIDSGWVLYDAFGFGSTASFIQNLIELPIEEEVFVLYSVTFAIFGFVLAGALLNRKSWGRTLAIAMAISIIVISGVQIALGLGFGLVPYISIVVAAIVLRYMRKSHVKAYFGRVK